MADLEKMRWKFEKILTDYRRAYSYKFSRKEILIFTRNNKDWRRHLTHFGNYIG